MPILETRELTKDFDRLRAVDGVSLRVEEDTLHSIIGPNGAGKTTLFNLISAQFKPTHGRVIFRGRDVTGLPAYRLAKLGIARSFQVTNIFPNLTVLENVRLSAQAHGSHNFKVWRSAASFKQDDRAADEALAQVGLRGRAADIAVTLPHGDKRKLELAILLAGDPQLLLLDEPTAGMSTEQVPALMDTIRAIRAERRCAVVLVEHNMNVVMTASDRITVMHHGRVLAEGAPREIAANSDVQRAYLGTDARPGQTSGLTSEAGRLP